MKRAIWIVPIAFVAACVVGAQSPAQPQSATTPAKSSTQSPASLPAPKTASPQVYPPEQIQAGEQRFTAECGFCHGRDAAGGETGPDLTRSALVAGDTGGDKIGPLVRAGRPVQRDAGL